MEIVDLALPGIIDLTGEDEKKKTKQDRHTLCSQSVRF